MTNIGVAPDWQLRSVEPGDVDIDNLSGLDFVRIDDEPAVLEQSGPSKMDEAAALAQSYICDHYKQIVNGYIKQGLLAQDAVSFKGAQRVAKALKQGFYDLAEPQSLFAPQHASQQLSPEDLWATFDYVNLPMDIDFALYEDQMFQQSHLSGACIDIIAKAVTMRGIDLARYTEDFKSDEDLTDPESQAEEAAGEAEEATLQAWIDGLHPSVTEDFRAIIQHTAASLTCVGNAYWEIIRDESDVPTSIRTFITSTVRVLRHERGYVQWYASAIPSGNGVGQFVWFNRYMPDADERAAGTKIWEDYWNGLGFDPYGDEFQSNPLSHQLSSAMPEGVFNPYLNEVIHFKDISLTSKYYGFPRDFRLGALHKLLEYSLLHNIKYQQHGQTVPFVLVFHGELTSETKRDLQAWLKQREGIEGYRQVPVLTAPVMPGTTGVQKGALEIIKVGGEGKEGLFQEFIGLLVRHYAMHYRIPIDMLTTENSNRASVTEAEARFNAQVVEEFHKMLEPVLQQMTKRDLGLTRRYIKFVTLDVDDRQAVAQTVALLVDRGIMNPDEIRAEFYGKPSRPGGETYRMLSGVQIENEATEEGTALAGLEAMRHPQLPTTSENILTMPAPGQVPPSTPVAKVGTVPAMAQSKASAGDEEIKRAEAEMKARLDSFFEAAWKG